MYIPLLALFVAPLGIDLASRDLVSRSNLSPSVPEKAVREGSEQPSRVSTTTTPETPAPPSSVAAVAAAEIQPAAHAAISHAEVPTRTETVSEPEPSTETRPESPTAPLEADFATLMEAEILRLSNEARATHGLSSLTWNARLRTIAAGHSADMFANDYFEHEDEEGCSSSCRATNGGYRWKAIGENIYMMSGYKLTPEKAAAKVVEGWMDSPGHRANILGSSFTESGVGIAYDGTSIYVTAMYGKQR